MEAIQTTIDVQVKFMGDLPAVTGQRNIRVTLPEGSTVGSLLESLSCEYGPGFASRIFSGPAKLEHTVLIFVDGENIKARGGLAAKLGAGEVELLMLPVICGG
jgi:hypothetical protein